MDNIYILVFIGGSLFSALGTLLLLLAVRRQNNKLMDFAVASIVISLCLEMGRPIMYGMSWIIGILIGAIIFNFKFDQ